MMHNKNTNGDKMSIPGIPGAPNPTFRTRDRVYVSLDQVIVELCEELGEGDWWWLGRLRKRCAVCVFISGGKGAPRPRRNLGRGFSGPQDASHSFGSLIGSARFLLPTDVSTRVSRSRTLRNRSGWLRVSRGRAFQIVFIQAQQVANLVKERDSNLFNHLVSTRGEALDIAPIDHNCGGGLTGIFDRAGHQE